MHARKTILTLVIAALAAGCLGGATTDPTPGSATEPTAKPPTPWSGWNEFHPNWTVGGEVRWHDGIRYNASAEDEWATDGATYLYGRKAGSGADHAECLANEPPTGNQSGWGYVFIGRIKGHCVWAEHPDYVCLDASFCPAPARSAGSPPRG